MSTPSSKLLAAHANCLPVGTIVADFEIIGLVGEGGFGIVYLAKDVNLDRPVAVKEFMPSSFAGRVDGLSVAVRAANHRATYEAGLRSFINEAKMLARFSHPALVEVYRFWEGNGTAYMAMRYYTGETLRQHLARGDMVFDEETIAQTMAPIFDALEMLHREQVYHRDIAPDNIMLSDGKPVLLDFGSARRIIGDGTQALTTVLKPGYAPIEQYVDDGTMKQGPWTDVYALGGVLYHLATGKPPIQAVSRLLTDPLPSVHALVGDRFSMTFSNAVSKAMAVRLEDRLQNVHELSDMLGWNTARPTRVMTLPSAAYARQSAGGGDPALLAGSESPVTAPAGPANVVAAKAAHMGLSETKVEVADIPIDPIDPILNMSTRGEKPAHLPETVAKKDLKVPLVTVGLGVVVIAVYLLTRTSDPVVAVKIPAPIQTPALNASAGIAPARPLAASVAQPATSPPTVTPASGVLKLNISPWGTVVIDGVTRGISNPSQLRQVELDVGTHTIEIAKPDAPTHVQTIEVTANSPVTISHTFK